MCSSDDSLVAPNGNTAAMEIIMNTIIMRTVHVMLGSKFRPGKGLTANTGIGLK
jgi:hypothetical protein